jgi:hypothetical protein
MPNVTLSTKNCGKVNLTLNEPHDEGLARAHNLGPDNCGAAGVHNLERQENSSAVKGSLPRRRTTVKSHSETSAAFTPFALSLIARRRSTTLKGIVRFK